MRAFIRHGSLVLVSLGRRRLAVGILIAIPVAFYLATGDHPGRSVRALAFGITWAVSTVAFFAARSARELEPRLRLAGRPTSALVGARLAALVVAAAVLAVCFWLVVVVDLQIRSEPGVLLDYQVSALVAVVFGTAVGAVVAGELEGALVLFLFAGLQAVTNPAATVARFLPFWSSRELATVAVDGPDAASTVAALGHAGLVVALGAVVIGFGSRRLSR